jgi:hypothetical protein
MPKLETSQEEAPARVGAPSGGRGAPLTVDRRDESLKNVPINTGWLYSASAKSVE